MSQPIKRYNCDVNQLYKEIRELAPYKTRYGYGHEFRNDLYVWSLDKRDKFVKQYSWAIPCREAITAIKNFVGDDQILETGCGSGLWAFLLKSEGINIIPTDCGKEPFTNKYIDIEYLDCEDAVEKYPTPILFQCWSRVSPSNFKGNKYVYIGEGENGCTSGYPDKSWEIVSVFELKKWPALHDNIYFCVRKYND